MINLMTAEYGINYERDFTSGKINSNEYKESIRTNYKMVKNSLAAVNAYQSYQKTGADGTQFKYKSDNLFNVRELQQFKKIDAAEHEKRFEKLRAEYKERQRIRKLQLG